LQTNCTGATDPFAGALPTPTVGACTVNGANYSGVQTLSPRVYCGTFNFNGTGTLNLNPGLYIFNNTRWNINSGWSVQETGGGGVTFYFTNANSYIQINSGAAINITAPTIGTYADILIFEPSGLSTSSFSINGAAGHVFKGLIYLPSRNITFNSVSTVASEYLTIVVNTLILDNVNWNIKSSNKQINAPGGATTQTVLRYLK
jgi:hypothetical protein